MPTRPISILIVEDDQFVRMFLSDMFILHGHEYESKIKIAATSDEAEKLIDEMTPDIIFLDLGLPKTSEGPVDPNAGFKLLEKIRATSNTKKAPVIIFSGYGDAELKERAIKGGAQEFLIKGEYLPKDIINIVKKYCSTGTCVENPKLVS